MTPHDRIYDTNAAALACWSTGGNRAAAATYLARRGIDPAALPLPYRLGYARPGWTDLLDHLRPAGYTAGDLLDAGLATRARTGRLIDRFRNRLVLPITNDQGKIAGFIGRSLSTEPRAPKYLNTPGTAAYRKSEHLYGLHEGRQLNRIQPVLVEGPLDALAIAAAHDPKLLPVASCGTALTAPHAAIIAAWCREHHVEPVLAYDGDPPGQAAALRAGELLRGEGLYPSVAVLPAGVDPAEHLTAGGDLAPFRTRPDGTAIPLPAAVARHIVHAWHHRWNPDWADTKTAIAHAIADYVRTYRPADLAAAAGAAATVARAEAAIHPDTIRRYLVSGTSEPTCLTALERTTALSLS